MWRWAIYILVALLVAITVALFNVLKSTEIAPGVQLIQPRLSSLGANVLVHTDPTGRIVVDSQLPALGWLVGLRLGKLTADDNVVITHWHPDHSGGFTSFAGDARVWSDAQTVDRLSREQTGHQLTAPGSVHHFAARLPENLPNNFIPANGTLNGATLTVIPAAHTEADVAVLFPTANVFAVGDLVWPSSFPFIDTHSGGSVTGLISALDWILSRSNHETTIVPGHGQPMSKTDLIAYRQMVIESFNAVCRNPSAAALIPWQSWASALVPISRWLEMIQADTTNSACKNDDA